MARSSANYKKQNNSIDLVALGAKRVRISPDDCIVAANNEDCLSEECIHTATCRDEIIDGSALASPISADRRRTVGIVYPEIHDVLLGRGQGANNHAGNIRFRHLVSQYKRQYMEASKTQKPAVAANVVEIWRKQMTPPGRFLAKSDPSIKTFDNGECIWHVVEDKLARKKVSQCLREKYNINSLNDIETNSYGNSSLLYYSAVVANPGRINGESNHVSIAINTAKGSTSCLGVVVDESTAISSISQVSQRKNGKTIKKQKIARPMKIVDNTSFNHNGNTDVACSSNVNISEFTSTSTNSTSGRYLSVANNFNVDINVNEGVVNGSSIPYIPAPAPSIALQDSTCQQLPQLSSMCQESKNTEENCLGNFQGRSSTLFDTNYEGQRQVLPSHYIPENPSDSTMNISSLDFLSQIQESSNQIKVPALCNQNLISAHHAAPVNTASLPRGKKGSKSRYFCSLCNIIQWDSSDTFPLCTSCYFESNKKSSTTINKCWPPHVPARDEDGIESKVNGSDQQHIPLSYHVPNDDYNGTDDSDATKIGLFISDASNCLSGAERRLSCSEKIRPSIDDNKNEGIISVGEDTERQPVSESSGDSLDINDKNTNILLSISPNYTEINNDDDIMNFATPRQRSGGGVNIRFDDTYQNWVENFFSTIR